MSLAIRLVTILILFYLNGIKSSITGRIFGSAALKCGKQASGKYLTISSKTENPLPTECSYTIKARSAYVCQLRIDFDMNLAQPSIPSTENNLTYAECITDYLDVGAFKVCGANQNQHIYLPFNRTLGIEKIRLLVKIRPRTVNQEIPWWNLKISQLECSKGSPRSLIPNLNNNIFSENYKDLSFSFNEGIMSRTFFKDGFIIAPNGCTQYFPESSGNVETFNFNNGKGIYIGNFVYAICFRRTRLTTALSLTFNHFELGFETNNTLEQLDNNCLPQIETIGHSEDYLMISNGKIQIDNIRATYFCGLSLHRKKIISNIPGPLKITFNSDNIYRENKPEHGFRFNYEII